MQKKKSMYWGKEKCTQIIKNNLQMSRVKGLRNAHATSGPNT